LAAYGEFRVAAVRRGIALAHLALERTDSLAWWGLLQLTSGVGPSFIDFIYEECDGAETFGEALLRLHQSAFQGAPSVGARAATRLVENTLAIVDNLVIDPSELDQRGWGGWLLDQLNATALSGEAVRLFEMVGRAVAPEEGIHGFLSNLEPMGKDLAAEEAAGVRLMTISRSKGLTFNTTVVLAVEEGVIPLQRQGIDVAEERRLLYVAMTRATELCALTYAKRRTGPSARFGSSRVNAARNRCPLLASLPGQVGQVVDGPAFVEALETRLSEPGGLGVEQRQRS
jgi:hypothetical protein